jgi:hypothetical protein
MADVVKAEGLVITLTKSGNVYPLACTKNATLSISRDYFTLASKTLGKFKEFIPAKKTFTISGTGLLKLTESFMHGFQIFDLFGSSDTMYTAYLDIIDAQNNFYVYKFNCYFTDISLESTSGTNFATYSYTLQGTGGFTIASVYASPTVTSGQVTANDPDAYKLVAVGIDGKWYYNYTVEGTSPNFYINIGTQFNGKTANLVYFAI